LDSLKNTAFFPQRGYNRLSSMIETRPDWCVSRQRAWGVPIAIFVHRETGELLRDETVLNRIAEIFEQEGSDAWFARDPQDFLGNNHSAEDWQPVTDIVEVWFESGSTHAFVLEKRDDLHWPASLYLEGSDQHRGWFHSSLLESCGTRGRAPYDAVLTHGFILDEKGNKMSKSEGNQVSPAEVQEQYGADILRLWVVGVDYSQDLRIGPEILKQQADSYRRIRNTLRYLLGALSDFDAGERVAAAEMPELERWVLHRLVELDRHVRAAIEGYDFHELFHALHQFCNEELSAFYFDIRKDSLYCDRPEDPRRRAARTVMDQVYQCLVTWLAPVLCFTTEEAWQARHGTERGSVHEQLYPDIPEAWRDAALGEKWANVRRIRRVVTGALERERAEKRIGAFLQAHPTVYVSADLAPALEGVDLAEVAIASDVTVEIGEGPSDGFRIDEVPGVAVVPGFAEGEKCQRCWKVLPEVGTHHGLPGVCTRCADAVISLQQAAE
jgi:isoleucyl-tRNA synthetase